MPDTLYTGPTPESILKQVCSAIVVWDRLLKDEVEWDDLIAACVEACDSPELRDQFPEIEQMTSNLLDEVVGTLSDRGAFHDPSGGKPSTTDVARAILKHLEAK